MPNVLAVENLCKSYGSGGHLLEVVKDVSFSIAAGDTFAIVGPSGSGKTTLLGLCAGLDRPSSGRVVLDGIDLTKAVRDISPETSVILMTAYSHNMLAKTTKGLQFDGYLIKPFTVAQIRTMVTQILSRD